jgi:uncharacterized protein CbrC (UPF0167 family)
VEEGRGGREGGREEAECVEKKQVYVYVCMLSSSNQERERERLCGWCMKPMRGGSLQRKETKGEAGRGNN